MRGSWGDLPFLFSGQEYSVSLHCISSLFCAFSTYPTGALVVGEPNWIVPDSSGGICIEESSGTLKLR